MPLEEPVSLYAVGLFCFTSILTLEHCSAMLPSKQQPVALLLSEAFIYGRGYNHFCVHCHSLEWEQENGLTEQAGRALRHAWHGALDQYLEEWTLDTLHIQELSFIPSNCSILFWEDSVFWVMLRLAAATHAFPGELCLPPGRVEDGEEEAVPGRWVQWALQWRWEKELSHCIYMPAL